MAQTGALVVNADDWGRDRDTTSRILDCAVRRTLSSVSAMVFMKDSERAADIARERGIDAGLHLNFTSPFSAPGISTRLSEHQQPVSLFLRRHRLAPVIFHPGLVRSFEYVVAAQREEYCRLYGAEPERIDGHHHMHLCSNVVLAKLIPAGTVVRRSFSFQPGEKSFANRMYRQLVDRQLARRHRLTDFFFSLGPLDRPDRFQRFASLANKFTVEVMTHPVDPREYRFLAEGECLRWTGDVAIAPKYAVCRRPELSNAR